MELSYVVAAIKRYLWVVQLAMLLGLVAAIAFSSTRTETYEAEAQLIVLPPASTPGETTSEGSDRYIESQTAVLESDDLADQVAASLGLPISVAADSLEVTTRTASDVVTLTVTAARPELARDLVNEFALQYLTNRDISIGLQNDEAIGTLTLQLDQLETQLGELNAELTGLPLEPTNPQDRLIQGNLSAQISSVQAEINALKLDRNRLELAADQGRQDSIAQTALEARALGGGGQLLVVAGALAGLILGVALVVTYAGSTGRVLDTVQLEERLGAPVVGTFFRMRGRKADLDHVGGLLEELPPSAATLIDELCVQAEAGSRAPGTLTVVVTGTRLTSGATTTAMAMAGRFALNGSRVTVVDAHHGDPRITDEMVGFEPGVTDLLSHKHNGTSHGSLDIDHLVLGTPLPTVGVLGVGSAQNGAMQRADVQPMLDSLRASHADIVIIDAGPMLKSAAAVRLAQLADVAVVTVPYRRERVEPLTVIARLLADGSSTLLPVATEPGRPKPRTRSLPEVAVEA